MAENPRASRECFRIVITKVEDNEDAGDAIQPEVQADFLHPGYKPKVSNSIFTKNFQNSHSMEVSQEIQKFYINKNSLYNSTRFGTLSMQNSIKTNYTETTLSPRSKKLKKASCECLVF